MQHNIEIGLLLDTYGPLLTERQHNALNLHYNDDYSLKEIADSMTISRQAVHDMIKKGEQKLYDYEKLMGQLERYMKVTQNIEEAVLILSSAQNCCKNDDIDMAIDKLKKAKEFWEDN